MPIFAGLPAKGLSVLQAAEGQGFRVAPFRSPKDALDFVAYLFLQRSILAIMNAADRRTTQ